MYINIDNQEFDIYFSEPHAVNPHWLHLLKSAKTCDFHINIQTWWIPY
jgi:hypothetical protein